MLSYSKQSMQEGFYLSLVETRKNIVDLLKLTGHMMSFEEKRDCEWDLFYVHGILEFGYSASELKQAISLMKKKGMDPRDYSILDEKQQPE